MELSVLELSQSAKNISTYSQSIFRINQLKEHLGIVENDTITLPNTLSPQIYIQEVQRTLYEISQLTNLVCASAITITPEINRWKEILPCDEQRLSAIQDAVSSLLRTKTKDIDNATALKYSKIGNNTYENTLEIGKKLIHYIPQFANADTESNAAFQLLQKHNNLTNKDIECLIRYIEQETDPCYYNDPTPVPEKLKLNLPIVRAICKRKAKITEETQGDFRILFESI